MACEVISGVENKYEFAKEDVFGTIPGSPTILDIGHVQSISVDEDESVEEISSMNSGHTFIDFDDDLYNVSGQIVTKITKASLPVLLEALLGNYTDDATDYTVITEAVCSDDLSYFMKFNTTAGNIKEMKGICFTGGDVSVEKDGSIEMTLNYQAQILTSSAEVLSPSTTVGALFRGLDAVVTYDGNPTILNNFNFSMDWNFNIDDSRGIEASHANGRRVIKRIIRNGLNLTGNFESQMDDNVDTGYADERSSVPIVLTLDRGTDNAHVFTFATSRTNTRSRELNNDNSAKVLTCDFVGTDIGVIGDL